MVEQARTVSSGRPVDSGSPSNRAHDDGWRPAAETLGSVNLPRGGGAVRDIGEKFSVNPASGTPSLTVPIVASPGRSGFGPSLSLRYDAGAGNGPFGFGWDISIASITRKTDKGLPRYLDDDESDVFLLSDAEDLVPVLDENGQRLRPERTVNDVAYVVAHYRPRIEGLFARVERWTAVASGITHWRTISRDNVTTLYGFEAGSCLTDPADPRRIFAWHICRSFDDRGNLIRYEYAAEDERGVDTSQAHEANRTPSARTAQRYLKRICYSFTSPYSPDWSEQGAEVALPDAWHCELVFDYGDHADDAPLPAPDRPWPVRPDPYSSYRSGFEVRTYRRCRRVLLFHHFPNEAGVGVDCLIRSNNFGYSDDDAPSDPRNPVYTYLTSVTQTGYRRDGNGYLHRSMPPLEFAYSRPELHPGVLTLDDESVRNLPEGLGGTHRQWLDLDGEGLPGVLSEYPGGWFYKRNLSPLNEQTLPDGSRVARAAFGRPEMVATLPVSHTLTTERQRFLDLSGDGQPDLVAFDGPARGFYERTISQHWSNFQPFRTLPAIDWNDPNLRFVDLTGDGLADLLLTGDDLFTIYPSRGEAGFEVAEFVRVAADEARGPRVVFADGTETVALADMNGDGLSDLVRVRNGEVCYWPNLGYGHFGARVSMDTAPRFSDDERFDPRRIRLADIDGSGTADLFYVGPDGVLVCFNNSGNSWGAPQQLAVFPSADAESAVQVVDLLGNGTACLVWSSPLPASERMPIRYVDLMGGQKPHLLVRLRNNLGSETCVHYAPSTRFYLVDKASGRPWLTRLPFPVHVVERVEVFDWIGRSRFVTRYAYHHGYFDGQEREFRGFGMVEQWDTEEHQATTDFPDATNWDETSWSPPVCTRNWFHTGAFFENGSLTQQYGPEYWVEPALRGPDRAADRAAMELPDSQLPDNLTAEETREAYRALKGVALRTEIYHEDEDGTLGNPYSVTAQNVALRLVQSRGINRHAVFFRHPQEQLSLHYERQADDPRVLHTVTLEVDPFGNVKRAVSVNYPRRAGYPEPEPTLAAAFRGMLAYDQTRPQIVASEHRYTADLTDAAQWPDTHRTPLPSESISAELTGIVPASQRAGITNRFRFAELDGHWQTAWDGNHDRPFEELPTSDIDGAGALPNAVTRRIVEQTRTLYRRDDLTVLLALDELQPQALPGESYRLALTPSLVSRIFDNRLPDATISEGGYVQLPGSNGWWIPSGRVFYSTDPNATPAAELAEARAHFYLTRRAVDSFGAVAQLDYDAPYDLLPTRATNPVGNVTSAEHDYRLLRPFRVTDINGNRVEVASDTLGMVSGTAVMGKANEQLGDSLDGFEPDLNDAVLQAHFADPLNDPVSLLGGATSRLVYDLFAYQRTRDNAQPDPPGVYAIARETHVSDLAPNETTRFQYAFTYSDGFGREIQQKLPAEPGPVVAGGADVSPRWVGSGWTIFDNKGRPVRIYEPFFSATHRFEFARQVGVATTTFYDPPGRVVATLHPDSSWEKVELAAWRQESWDVNDTILLGDPRDDATVGDYFRRLLGAAPDAFTSWHDQRIGGTFGASPADRAAAQDAAQKSEAHANTTTVVHFDPRGRACLSVTNNGDHRLPSRTALDTEDAPLVVFDALGRRTLEYIRREQNGGLHYVCGYDLTGSLLYLNGMDDGERRRFTNVAGNPIRLWDARGHVFRLRFDAAQRPTHRFVSANGGAEIVLERSLYGEGQPERNLNGRLFRQYESGGLASFERFDFKGNLLESARQLPRDYRQTVDWSPLIGLIAIADLDAAAAPLLEQERFAAASSFDALNRPMQSVTPHSAAMTTNVLRASYNEAGLLDRFDVWLNQANAPAVLLDPAGADLHAVTGLTFNARGQRMSQTYGNGVVCRYDYDPLTFRLTRVQTTRPNSFAANQRLVQDLNYTYDPSGNITRIRDDADTQNVIYFNNQRVNPTADYTYDASYRLMRATGREHLGQTGGALNAPQQITNDDRFRVRQPHPHDGNAMATYTETYNYDDAGNLLSMLHHVASGSWTQRYDYVEASHIDSGDHGNRLSSTSLPGDPANGPFSATYSYDEHGNMSRMPHLPSMRWDEQDRLAASARQVVNAGTPETTYYVYDISGRRLRKCTDRQAAQGETGRRKSERLYLGPLEIYREYAGDGTTVTLARETLQLIAGPDRVALIETRTAGNDAAPAQLIRYQHANHLGSALLELDDQAAIISYEEYFPFGGTAYQAVRNQTDLPKRHRFAGKERDEENDLYYFGARYYAAWLGRWTSCDPLGAVDGPNLYVYVRNNPITLVDPNGRQSTNTQHKSTHHAQTGPRKKAVTIPHTFTGKETEEDLHKLAQANGVDFTAKPVWIAKTHSWFVGDLTPYKAPPQDQTDQPEAKDGPPTGAPPPPDTPPPPHGDPPQARTPGAKTGPKAQQGGGTKTGDGEGSGGPDMSDTERGFFRGLLKGIVTGIVAGLVIGAMIASGGTLAIIGGALAVGGAFMGGLTIGQVITGETITGRKLTDEERAEMGGELLGGVVGGAVGGSAGGRLVTPDPVVVDPTVPEIAPAPRRGVYIPRDADGNPVPLRQQTVRGQDIPLPDPNAQGPHTTLGGKVSSETGETYRQSATFPGETWPKAAGEDVPWSRVDWTDHGRPDVHPNPHHHEFTWDPVQKQWMSGPAKPFHGH